MAEITLGSADASQVEPRLAHLRVLRGILRFLATDDRIAPMHERILVFGSAESGKDVPSDVDAYFDFSDCRHPVSHPSSIPQSGLLLALAERHHGRFDPYLRVGRVFYARNHNCNGWVYAREPRALRRKGEAGRSPWEVYLEIRARCR